MAIGLKNLFYTFVFLAISIACASSINTMATEPQQGEVIKEVNQAAKTDSCKNKVLVYPPSDISAMKRNGEKTAGSPTEYCNEEELLQKRKSLIKTPN